MIDPHSFELVLAFGVWSHVVLGVLTHSTLKLVSAVDTTTHALMRKAFTLVQQTKASSPAFLLPLFVEYMLLFFV
jgi:hypothetical protein